MAKAATAAAGGTCGDSVFACKDLHHLPKQSLHWFLWRWCWQMPPPPHSLQ
jgi:hypothetical protein